MSNAKVVKVSADQNFEGMMEIIFRDRMEHLSLMSSALVHELYTPLIIIRGRVEGLLRHPEQNVDQGLKEVSAECQHLLKLLESLTFMASSDARIKISNMCLKSIVDDVLILFEKICLDRGISLTVDIPDTLRIDTEPDRLKNILISLLSNAMESFDRMAKGGIRNVLIHTQQDRKKVHLIISDTGSGMSPTIQSRILKSEFFSTKSHQGLGVGLVLAQKIANDLKIGLSFISQEGQGTTFTLSFT
jgi:signal transduction histidine kinase